MSSQCELSKVINVPRIRKIIQITVILTRLIRTGRAGTNIVGDVPTAHSADLTVECKGSTQNWEFFGAG